MGVREDQEKALERVQVLFKKAEGSDSVEEARTSAYIAVKLILKHKLVVSLPKPKRRSEAEEIFNIDIEEIFRQAQQRSAERQATVSPEARAREAANVPPKARTVGIHYEVDPPTRTAACGYCGRPFGFSDTVLRAHPGGVCIHRECMTAYEATHG